MQESHADEIPGGVAAFMAWIAIGIKLNFPAFRAGDINGKTSLDQLDIRVSEFRSPEAHRHVQCG